MNKITAILFFLLRGAMILAQPNANIDVLKQHYHYATSNVQKTTQALDIVNACIDMDANDSAQQWIYKARQHAKATGNDTLLYFVLDAQTENYYFANLTNFAKQSAEQELLLAQKINDSALLSNAFMYISYLAESEDSLAQSIAWAKKALTFSAKSNVKTYRALISKSQILNNLAQVYIKLQSADSAYYFNGQALNLAMREKANRSTTLCYSNLGRIFLQKGLKDSALFYLSKSNTIGRATYNNDIVLLNNSFILQLNTKNCAAQNLIAKSSFALIDSIEINTFYLHNFYSNSIESAKDAGNEKLLIQLQEKLVMLDKFNAKKGNALVQSMSKQYIENENSLLLAQADEVKRNGLIKFLLAVAIAAIVLTTFIVYFFTNKRKKSALQALHLREQSLEQERLRIALDMHDEIGANISRIRYITLGMQASSNSLEEQKLHGKVLSLSDDSVEKMNEIVWSLNKSSFTIEEMFAYIRKVCSELGEESAVDFNLDFPTDNLNLNISAEACRNIYLICKEAVINAIRHSNCTSIDIMASAGSTFILTVKDNGCGYNTIQHQTTGNGLSSMKKRAQMINAEVNIVSTSVGTVVKLELPLL